MPPNSDVSDDHPLSVSHVNPPSDVASILLLASPKACVSLRRLTPSNHGPLELVLSQTSDGGLGKCKAIVIILFRADDFTDRHGLLSGVSVHSKLGKRAK